MTQKVEREYCSATSEMISEWQTSAETDSEPMNAQEGIPVGGTNAR